MLSTAGRDSFQDADMAKNCWHFQIDFKNPTAEPVVLQPRQFGLRYYPEHHGENFLIVTNKDGATEMCLMYTPVTATEIGSVCASGEIEASIMHSGLCQECSLSKFVLTQPNLTLVS